jgi:ADP-heptose:LPS heptosyltransferase
MHRIFILRAFGDFVIFLNSICQSKKKGDYKIVVSVHLQPLFDALKNEINTQGLQIEFVNFRIDKGQLRLFTNRHFISLQTLREVNNIKGYLKNNPNTTGTDYIEQNKRVGLLNGLTNHSFQPIVFNKEVYFSYDQFFENETFDQQSFSDKDGDIVIFPNSRLVKKDIPANVLEDITTHFQSKNIRYKIASFEKQTIGANENKVQYHNFETLIQIIKSAHVVIGADSLPVHLACILQIPHYILYNDQLGRYFITPYAKNNKSFGTFGNYESLLKNAF